MVTNSETPCINFACPVVRIKLENYPDIESLQIARFGEHQWIVGTGAFEDGGLAVYIPPNAVIPSWMLPRRGWQAIAPTCPHTGVGPGTTGGVTNHTVPVDGISPGLLLPVVPRTCPQNTHSYEIRTSWTDRKAPAYAIGETVPLDQPIPDPAGLNAADILGIRERTRKDTTEPTPAKINTDDSLVNAPESYDLATIEVWVYEDERTSEELALACLGMASEMAAMQHRLDAYASGLASECARAAIRGGDALRTENAELRQRLAEK